MVQWHVEAAHSSKWWISTFVDRRWTSCKLPVVWRAGWENIQFGTQDHQMVEGTRTKQGVSGVQKQ